MNFLEERIVKDGVVKEGGVLKVDSFLNHQMDIGLIEEIAKEFKRRFGKKIRESGRGYVCCRGGVLHPQEHQQSHRGEKVPVPRGQSADHR